MKHIILIGLLTTPIIADHHMQSDEARNMEAEYQEKREYIPHWSKYWSEVRSIAQQLTVKSFGQEKERYERIVRCANFLEKKRDYFDHRDHVNEMTQDIDNATAAAVHEKGLDHPLCQKIEAVCKGDVKGACIDRLLNSVRIASTTEYLPPVWWWWGNEWYPYPGHYILADQDSVPEPEIAQKAQALLACRTCLEQDQTARKLKEEFDRRFINRGK